MNKKILWIENLKGFTMLAVVLGHIATPLTNIIFSWHMPAFFFLSGFFIKPESLLSESVKKEMKRLVLPFLLFGLFGIVMEIMKRNLFSGFEFAVKDFVLIEEIQGLFFWMDLTHMHQYGFVLWFLMALFWGKLILQFFLKVIRNKIIISILCLGFFFLLANQSFIFPFSIDKGLFSMSWIFLGYLYYNYCVKEETFKFESYLVAFALVVLILLPVPLTNVALKVAEGPWASFFFSFSAVLLITTLFKKFGDTYLSNPLFENWGKNSLIILVLHPYTNNVGYVVGNKFFNGNWGVNFTVSVIILVVSLIAIKYAREAFANSRFAHRLQSTRAH